MNKQNKQKKNKNKNQMVSVPRRELDQLRSRPKQKTLIRDSRGGLMGGKGKRGNAYLSALMNPFEIHGAKIPDLCSFPSGTTSIYNKQSITLNTANNYGWVWQPKAFQESSTASVAIGSNFVWGSWSQDSIFTNYNGLVHSERVVSAGIRVRYLGATLSDSGMICACLLPRSEAFSTSVLTSSDIQNRPQSVCMRLADGLEFIWSPQDVTDYTYALINFSEISGKTQMPAICFAVTGHAANTPIMIEFFYNVEFIPETRSISYVETTVSPSEPGLLAQAETFISSVGSALGYPIGESKGSFLAKAAEQALPGLISAGGQFLKYRYARPSTRYIDYALD